MNDMKSTENNNTSTTETPNENKPKNNKGLIIGLVALLLVAVIGGVAYFMTQGKKEEPKTEYQEIQQIAYENEQTQVEIPIDFAEIQKKNSDIYAWIKIDNTVIDYPILQSVNDPEDYYLDHTVERAAGLPGAIYTRMTDAKDFSNGNTIIYGHNMKDGTMFKSLHEYEKKEYFDAHPYITIYTPTQALKYEVFAAVTYSDVLLTYAYDFSTEQGILNFVQSLKDGRNMSDQIKEGVEITGQDKLVTLSTCIANQPNNRYLVVGVLRNEG